MWGMFTDSVDRAIKRELAGEQIDPSWREYWLRWCEVLYYDPDGEAHVQYITRRRGAAGLPPIPEIEKRQFRSLWQIFADSVDTQLERESAGFAAPSFPNVNTWPNTWSNYWSNVATNTLRDPNLSVRGFEYIPQKRKEARLE